MINSDNDPQTSIVRHNHYTHNDPQTSLTSPFPHPRYGIVTLNMLQHDGCEEFVPGRADVNFNTSRNYTSPLLNFFAFDNGYHTIHHLAPTSHWTVNKVCHAWRWCNKKMYNY